MYVYVHWVLIQVVPFALLISMAHYFINDLWAMMESPAYKRNVLIRRRNASRNGGEEANAELDGLYK